MWYRVTTIQRPVTGTIDSIVGICLPVRVVCSSSKSTDNCLKSCFFGETIRQNAIDNKFRATQLMVIRDCRARHVPGCQHLAQRMPKLLFKSYVLQGFSHPTTVYTVSTGEDLQVSNFPKLIHTQPSQFFDELHY